MRVLVYGNCQAGPIGRLLEIAAPNLEVVRVAPVHTILPADHEATVSLFRAADVVLSQPIGPGFGALSTEALKAQVGAREWVMYPSIYFSGAFPYLQYLRNRSGPPMRGPLGDYHDTRILQSFVNGLDEQACLKALEVEDPDLCRTHFNEALAESIRREATLDISVINDNSMRDLLLLERSFHTFNHPSNKVMWQVVSEFLKLMSIPIAAGAKPPVTQFLDEISAAIPPEMTSAVGLTCTDPVYRVRREPISTPRLVEDFYRLYRQTEDFAALVAFNRERNSNSGT
jgi:hypothetical protein